MKTVFSSRFNHSRKSKKENGFGIGDPDQNLFSYIQNRSGKPLIHATFIEDVAP